MAVPKPNTTASIVEESWDESGTYSEKPVVGPRMVRFIPEGTDLSQSDEGGQRVTSNPILLWPSEDLEELDEGQMVTVDLEYLDTRFQITGITPVMGRRRVPSHLSVDLDSTE